MASELTELALTCRWYKEGFEARKVGEQCPYALNSPKWILWMEGYLAAAAIPNLEEAP